MKKVKSVKERTSFKMKCMLAVLSLMLMVGSFASVSQAGTYEISYVQVVEFDFYQFWINYLNMLQNTKPDLIFKSMDLCTEQGSTIGTKTLKGTITLQNIGGNYGINPQYQVKHRVRVLDGYSRSDYFNFYRESFSYVPYSYGTVSYNVSWEFYDGYLPTTFWLYLDVDDDVDELAGSNFFQHINYQNIPSC